MEVLGYSVGRATVLALEVVGPATPFAEQFPLRHDNAACSTVPTTTKRTTHQLHIKFTVVILERNLLYVHFQFLHNYKGAWHIFRMNSLAVFTIKDIHTLPGAEQVLADGKTCIAS